MNQETYCLLENFMLCCILENLYSNFYTEKAASIAKERQHSAIEFYNSLYQEVNSSYQNGRKELNNLLESSSTV